jgi:hypothetical protein
MKIIRLKIKRRKGPRFDRAAVMRRAHQDYRHWQRAEEPKSFRDCLKGAWAVAHHAREIGSHKFQLAA